MKRKIKLFAVVFLILASLPIRAQDSLNQALCGIYLMNLYDLNVSEYSFYADFYVWMKWRHERDPLNVEFVNAVEKWGFTQNYFSAALFNFFGQQGFHSALGAHRHEGRSVNLAVGGLYYSQPRLRFPVFFQQIKFKIHWHFPAC